MPSFGKTLALFSVAVAVVATADDNTTSPTISTPSYDFCESLIPERINECEAIYASSTSSVCQALSQYFRCVGNSFMCSPNLRDRWRSAVDEKAPLWQSNGCAEQHKSVLSIGSSYRAEGLPVPVIPTVAAEVAGYGLELVDFYKTVQSWGLPRYEQGYLDHKGVYNTSSFVVEYKQIATDYCPFHGEVILASSPWWTVVATQGAYEDYPLTQQSNGYVAGIKKVTVTFYHPDAPAEPIVISNTPSAPSIPTDRTDVQKVSIRTYFAPDRFNRWCYKVVSPYFGLHIELNSTVNYAIGTAPTYGDSHEYFSIAVAGRTFNTSGALMNNGPACPFVNASGTKPNYPTSAPMSHSCTTAVSGDTSFQGLCYALAQKTSPELAVVAFVLYVNTLLSPERNFISLQLQVNFSDAFVLGRTTTAATTAEGGSSVSRVTTTPRPTTVKKVTTTTDVTGLAGAVGEEATTRPVWTGVDLGQSSRASPRFGWGQLLVGIGTTVLLGVMSISA